ncbi:MULTISPECIES: hypothetical protein [Protofrankia]|uniref:Thioredoxin domain-containing protein n=1 Tax=Protofrankia coriariae TaxID=1562887 RepID=A0ABR5F6E6_9ACTN|nr:MULTISPECIES: hypothetical protein [Protofrankia]KLL12238.1 hypothetical protein FrCorBMG51_05845 [Protofrankia coriariae]ONH37835.1 hypothetical protein BL254_02920 [Protofrankia sp. BMG5.30]
MHVTPPPPPASGDDGNGPGHEDDQHAHLPHQRWEELPPVDVRIPDDLSELDDEVAAYQAELRAQRRRERVDRLVPGLRSLRGRRRRPGRRHRPDLLERLDRRDRPRAPGGRPRHTSGAAVALIVIVLAALGAMVPLVLAHPRPLAPQGAVPLASTTAPPGAVGGLLPGVPLSTARTSRPATDLRPALIVLLPVACECPRAIHEIVSQAREGRPIPTYLVAPWTDDPSLERLVRQPDAAAGFAVGYNDPGASLSRLYRADPRQPTLLLVAMDGRLVHPPRIFTVGDRLEGWLGALPGR